MTTHNEPDENEKRLNLTAHQRAMTSPQVQEALNDLRASWNNLSPLQRGEQLNVLIGFKCSMRGIAKELGKPATSLRRYIALANPPEAGSDWIATMESTWAVEPQEQSEMSIGEDDRPIPCKIPAKKRVVPVVLETNPAKDPAHTQTVQQTKKITSPLPTRATEPPVVNRAMSGQGNQVGGNSPKTSLVDAWMNRGQITDDELHRLAAIPEQIARRPLLSARSMKRQGRPLPPTEPH